MKGKKYTIPLLVLVLGIWGTFAYKLFFAQEEEVWEIPPQFSTQKQISKDSLRLDTLPLALNYADPFLKLNRYIGGGSVHSEITTQKRTSVQNRTAAAQRRLKAKKPIIQWPELTYNGLMTGNDKSIGLLVVRGKNRLVAPDDEVYGITVKKLFADSIQLEYKKDLKTIVKTNHDE